MFIVCFPNNNNIENSNFRRVSAFVKITFTVAQHPVNVHNTDCCDSIVSHRLHNQGCVLAKADATVAKNCD
jgi:hypothetical protein